MGRKSKDTISINRRHPLFADIYDECCDSTDAKIKEGEKLILDIIIAQFILNSSRFAGGNTEATEREIADLFGISKSGVRVIFDRAMKKVKSALKRKGINKTDDVIDSARGRTAVGKGNVDG